MCHLTPELDWGAVAVRIVGLAHVKVMRHFEARALASMEYLLVPCSLW